MFPEPVYMFRSVRTEPCQDIVANVMTFFGKVVQYPTHRLDVVEDEAVGNKMIELD